MLIHGWSTGEPYLNTNYFQVPQSLLVNFRHFKKCLHYSRGFDCDRNSYALIRNALNKSSLTEMLSQTEFQEIC